MFSRFDTMLARDRRKNLVCTMYRIAR